MAEKQPPKLDEFLAIELTRKSDDLVDEWIAWLRDRVGLRPVKYLPREAILDHIPPVVRSIADFLHMPVEAVKTELVGHLRMHSRLRREQGYDIEELLKEYEGLDRIVSQAMVESLRRYPGDPDPIEVAQAFIRLREGLSEITAVTIGAYRMQEAQLRRELHRRLQEFARVLTHELKNPLQAVTAGAGMLEEREVAERPDERARYVALIQRGVRRFLDLIDEIRMLSLSEAAQAEEPWKPVRRIIDEVFSELQGMARTQDVRLEVEEPLPGATVAGVRTQIALLNLIGNAIKYADPEKSERYARVGARREPDPDTFRWEIWVKDNGRGIPDTAQPQIFEKHVRAHPDVAEGTGLGLAISRELVEQHGGRMWFESEEGVGSTFHFTVAGMPEGAEASEED